MKLEIKTYWDSFDDRWDEVREIVDRLASFTKGSTKDFWKDHKQGITFVSYIDRPDGNCDMFNVKLTEEEINLQQL